MGCPDCRDQGLGDIPLENAHGEHDCHCRNGHKFVDTEALHARNPKTLPIKLPQAPKVPVAGLVTITLQVQSKLRDALNERFGERLSSSLPYVLGSMLDPGAFIITGADAANLSEKAGFKISNAQSLAGIIYSLKQ